MTKMYLPLLSAEDANDDPATRVTETNEATGAKGALLYPRSAYALSDALEEIFSKAYLAAAVELETDNLACLYKTTFGNAQSWNSFAVIFAINEDGMSSADMLVRTNDAFAAFFKDMAHVAKECDEAHVDVDNRRLFFASPQAFLEFIRHAVNKLDLQTLDEPYGPPEKLEAMRETKTGQEELDAYFNELAEDGLEIDVDIPELHSNILTYLPARPYFGDHLYSMSGAIAQHDSLDFPMIDLEYLESIVLQETDPRQNFAKNPLLNLH